MHICSLCLQLYSCPANRLISTIFSRFHVCALIYDICFSLSYLTLYDKLYVHPHHYNRLSLVPFYC